MNRNFALTCLATLLITYVQADVIIEYKVTVGKENTLIDKSVIVPDRIIVSSNGEEIRVQAVSAFSQAQKFDLYKIGQQSYFTCIDFMGQKRAFKLKKQQMAITYPPDSAKYHVIGFPSKRAIAKSNSGDIEIYYTDLFGLNFFFEYGELNGIALKFKIPHKFFENITYEAISVSFLAVPKELFSRIDYTLQYPQEKQTVLHSWRGKQLPKIKVDDITGRQTLLDYKGKFTVINFWFVGCPPCKMEMPLLNELVRKYQDESAVQFVAVALDKAKEVQDFLKKGNVFSYEHFYNGRNAAEKSKIVSYPTHLMVDKEGTVLAEWNGFQSTTVAEIELQIEAQLRKMNQIKSGID